MGVEKGFHDLFLKVFWENCLNSDLLFKMDHSFLSHVGTGIITTPEASFSRDIEATHIVLSNHPGPGIENRFADTGSVIMRDKYDQFGELIFDRAQNAGVIQPDLFCDF